MNIFSDDGREILARYGESLTKAKKSAERQANQGRAPPRETGEKYSLDRYSDSQIENWKSSKKIVVYKNQQQLKRFVEKAVSQPDYNGKMYFGIVGKTLGAQLETATGIKLDGLNVTLRAGNVRKVFKDHGSEVTENKRGQRAITPNDFSLIPNVISEPEKVEASEYKGRPAVEFKKTVDDSRITVFAVNSGGSLELFVQTMYAGIKKRA